MKYVQSFPPLTLGTADRYEIRPIPAVEKPRPVQPRSLPPLVFQRHKREPVRDPAPQPERRAHDRYFNGERRTYCRRTTHRPMLLELRSSLDRRRRRQRATDAAEHIDEEA